MERYRPETCDGPNASLQKANSRPKIKKHGAAQPTKTMDFYPPGKKALFVRGIGRAEINRVCKGPLPGTLAPVRCMTLLKSRHFILHACFLSRFCFSVGFYLGSGKCDENNRRRKKKSPLVIVGGIAVAIHATVCTIWLCSTCINSHLHNFSSNDAN